jgi:O-antigen/teichoic acid export membrane protein
VRPASRGLARQVFSLFGVRALAALMQAGLLILLARLLGPAEFGSFVVALTVGAIAGVMTGLGSTMQALLLTASAEHRAIGTTLLGLRVATAVLAGAAAAAVCLALGLPVLAAMACATWSWAEVVTELIQSLLLGQRRDPRVMFSIMMRRLGPALGAVIAIVLGQSIWPWLLLGLLVGIASSFAVAGVVLATPAPVRPIVKSSRHFWSSTVLSTMQTADVAVVGLFSPSAATVGNYAAAARATSPLNLLTGSLVSVLTPRWAQVGYTRLRFESFLRARRALLLLAACLALGSPVAAWLAPVVLGSDYSGSSIFFAGVTVAAGVSAVVQGYSAFLFASDDAHAVSVGRLWSIPVGLVGVGIAAAIGSPLLLAAAPALSQVWQLVALSWATRVTVSR